MQTIPRNTTIEEMSSEIVLSGKRIKLRGECMHMQDEIQRKACIFLATKPMNLCLPFTPPCAFTRN